jgi:hypothetical protein
LRSGVSSRSMVIEHTIPPAPPQVFGSESKYR